MIDIRRRGVPMDLTVRFAETDQMGVVHHSVYAIWMEAGRVDWMDSVGMPYAIVAANGFNFAVTGITIEYRSPVRFGDDVRIVTMLDNLRSRHVSFQYAIYIHDGTKLCATGSSEHICVDEHGSMARIPQDVLNHMKSSIEK